MRFFPALTKDPKYISLLFLLVLLPVVILSLQKGKFTTRSHASSSTVIEAETGVLANGAVVGSDVNASNGQYVQFGSITNLLQNPGFESGSNSPWSPYGTINTTPSGVVSSNAHTGTYAMAVGSSTSEGGAEQSLAATPGAVYTVSGWGKVAVSGETVSIGLKFRDASNNDIANTDSSAPITSTSYQFVSANETAPSNAAKVVAYIWKGTPSNNFAYGDDLVLSSNVTPTPTPTTSSSPSGQAMPVGDLPGWHQIFAEDFTTPAPIGQFKSIYASKFNNYDDGWPNTDKTVPARRCTTKVVSAANGMMTYYMHQEKLASTDPCSGGTAGTYWLNAVEVPASNGTTINQLYGKYTIRFRVTGTLPGHYMVPLLWPMSENWPYDGEIDFPEGHLEGNICAFLHHQNGTSPSDQESFCPGVPFSPGWHTASTEWSLNNATFILDGNVIGTSTTRVPDTKMHYVLQTEACQGPCPADGTSANIDFDWVVIYSAP